MIISAVKTRSVSPETFSQNCPHEDDAKGFSTQDLNMNNMEEGGSAVLNITNTIRRLKTSHINLDSIRLSIIHKGASIRSEKNIKGEIRIRSITLYALQWGTK